MYTKVNASVGGEMILLQNEGIIVYSSNGYVNNEKYSEYLTWLADGNEPELV